MKQKIQNLVLLAFVVIGLIFFVKITMEVPEIVRTMRKVKFFYFIHQAILILLLYLISGYLSHLILIEFGVRQTPREWYGLTFVNAISNYLLPFRAGAMVRALYLRNKYGLLLSHTASTLVYLSYVNFMVTLLFGFGIAAASKWGLFSMPLSGEEPFEHLLTGIIVLCSLLLLGGSALQFSVLCFSFAHPLRNATFFRLRNIISLFANGAKKMAANSRLLTLMIAASIVSFLIQVVRLSAAYSAVGASPDFYHVLFVSMFFSLSFLLSIVPGNLGIQEILITLSSRLIGISFENGLVAAAVIRVVALGMILVLGGYFYLRLGVRKVILSRDPS